MGKQLAEAGEVFATDGTEAADKNTLNVRHHASLGNRDSASLTGEVPVLLGGFQEGTVERGGEFQ